MQTPDAWHVSAQKIQHPPTLVPPPALFGILNVARLERTEHPILFHSFTTVPTGTATAMPCVQRTLRHSVRYSSYPDAIRLGDSFSDHSCIASSDLPSSTCWRASRLSTSHTQGGAADRAGRTSACLQSGQAGRRTSP